MAAHTSAEIRDYLTAHRSRLVEETGPDGLATLRLLVLEDRQVAVLSHGDDRHAAAAHRGIQELTLRKPAGTSLPCSAGRTFTAICEQAERRYVGLCQRPAEGQQVAAGAEQGQAVRHPVQPQRLTAGLGGRPPVDACSQSHRRRRRVTLGSGSGALLRWTRRWMLRSQCERKHPMCVRGSCASTGCPVERSNFEAKTADEWVACRGAMLSNVNDLTSAGSA